MPGASFSEWTSALESISSVELALDNMCEGVNSRETTEYGILMCAKRILEKGWIQTSPFVWKWKTQEDAERFDNMISAKAVNRKHNLFKTRIYFVQVWKLFRLFGIKTESVTCWLR